MKEIKKWLDSKKQDYSQGVQLYVKHGLNKHLLRYFNHLESEPRKEKLIYELSKISNTPVPVKTPIVKNTGSITNNQTPSKTPFNQLPLIIQEVIKQKGNLYRERDQLHESMKSIPEDNKAVNIKARKVISDKIAHISERIDVLYAAQKHFEENNKLPDESILNWDPELPVAKHKIIKHSKLSDIELKNRQTNLRGNITKTKNLLLYQKTSKQTKKNPLPDGPKREKYETKLEKLTYELEEIGKEIEKRK